MVQFGPADYSMSIGAAGQRLNHPAVVEAERHVIATALKMGIHPRVELREPKGYERYLEMGVRHFNVGLDIRILHAWYQQAGDQLRAILIER
jgi:2-keto-3-deoxy-L-rhamnonate aldolase RhmA